jgi:hypothetical protein
MLAPGIWRRDGNRPGPAGWAVTALGMAVRQAIALGARGELLRVERLGGGPMWLRVSIAAAA